MNKTKAIKTYLVDTIVGFFWSWLILTPFAFEVWKFSLQTWFVWSWTAIPIWLIIGRPYVWLVMKSRTRLLGEEKKQ